MCDENVQHSGNVSVVESRSLENVKGKNWNNRSTISAPNVRDYLTCDVHIRAQNKPILEACIRLKIIFQNYVRPGSVKYTTRSCSVNLIQTYGPVEPDLLW